MPNDRDQSRQAPHGISGPELRLLERSAFVAFPARELAPGLRVTELALEIPDATFPFDPTGGPRRYQKRRLPFAHLELAVDAEAVSRQLAEVAKKAALFEGLRLHFRPGFIEGQAQVGRERAPLTFKVALVGEGERLVFHLYDLRLYAFCPVSVPELAVRLTRAFLEAAGLPEAEEGGASAFSARVLPSLVRETVVTQGFKLPALEGARLSALEVLSGVLRLRFSAEGLPPANTPDEALQFELDGARAFPEAELLLTRGNFPGGKDAYARYVQGAEGTCHPFALERLVTLLVAEPASHVRVLALVESLRAARPQSSTALWAEAIVRERQGDRARASECALALLAQAQRVGEQSAAFFAAESAARAGREQAPQVAVKALHELLSPRGDGLPGLRAAARAAELAGDPAAAMRAYRRMAALAKDASDAAEAHVRMAGLSMQGGRDLAGARLHCDAALRLQPQHPEALLLLAELCHQASEHPRALALLERLCELARGRHELDRVGKAQLLAGRIYETGLDQPEEALSRYREAVSLLPGEPAPQLALARLAERQGKMDEALAAYEQTLALAGPSPSTTDVRRAAHAANHALARMYRGALENPAEAERRLEAALALDPRDREALTQLLPLYRRLERFDALADALEKEAAIVEDAQQRAALFAEAARLHQKQLGNPEAAEPLYRQALDADDQNRAALEGLLELCEARGEAREATRLLRALSDVVDGPGERAALFQRLATVARDRLADVELAIWGFEAKLQAHPEDVETLDALAALHRGREAWPELGAVLERQAAATEAQGQPEVSAQVRRELAALYETRLSRPEEAVASLERAAALSPSADVWVALAEVCVRLGRHAAARRAFEEVLALQPSAQSADEEARVLQKLGDVCLSLGDADAATAHFSRAFSLRPLEDALSARVESLHEKRGDRRALAQHWGNRAEAFLGEGRSGEAAALLHRSAVALLALEEGQGNPTQREADLTVARERLMTALELSGGAADEGPILERLAELAMERGARAEAGDLCARRAALLADRALAARAWFKAARLTQDAACERERLDAAVLQDPHFAPARVRRAELLAPTAPREALAELEAALAATTRAGEASPKPRPPGEADSPSRASLLLLGVELASRVQQPETATRLLSQLVAERPEDPVLLHELAARYRASGATAALCNLLGGSWRRHGEAQQATVLREYAELCLALGRRSGAELALRELRQRQAEEPWTSATLLSLLNADDGERLALLTALVDGAEGGTRAAWLLQRARLHTHARALDEAHSDFAAHAALGSPALEVSLEWVELSQRREDAPAELEAWRHVVVGATGAEEGTPDGFLASLPPAEGKAAVALLAAAKRLPTLAGLLPQGSGRTHAREALSLALALPLPQETHGALALEVAGAAEALGDRETALRALAEAARTATPQTRAEAQHRRAVLLEQAGERQKAADAYAAVLGLVPDHEEAEQGQLRMLRELEQWEPLAAALTRAARADRSPEVLAPFVAELGLVQHRHLHQPDEALASLRRAVALGAEGPDVLLALVERMLEEQLFEEAAFRALQRSKVTPPEEAVEHLWKTGETVGVTDGPLAWTLWSRAHALVPLRGERLVALAELSVTQATPEEAAALHEEQLASLPEEAPWQVRRPLLLRIASLWQRANVRDRAESHYRAVLAHEPQSSTAARALAGMLENASPEAALDVLWTHAQALEESPETYAVLLDLATRAETSGQPQRAVEILRRAIQMSAEPRNLHARLVELLREEGETPALLEALCALGALALEEGDTNEACVHLELAVALAERLERTDDALTALRQMRNAVAANDRKAAAVYERRRGMLLLTAKSAPEAANDALEKSFELWPALETAESGSQVAAQLGNAALEADWLERTLTFDADPVRRAERAFALATLLDEKLQAPERAERALREVLRLVSHHEAAEAKLEALLAREGRHAELARHLEERAERAGSSAEKVRLFRQASRLYRAHMGALDAAAGALFAARAVAPEDRELVIELADVLHAGGRRAEGAEFDGVLLEESPLLEPSFSRRAAFLKEEHEHADYADLMLRRAEHEQGRACADSLLAAAEAFRALGAEERAMLCEEQAMELDPSHPQLLASLSVRAGENPRRAAELLERRAEAMPEEAETLLRARAKLLLEAGEQLLAAEALEDLLAVRPDDLDALQARAELAVEGGGGPLASSGYDRRLLDAGEGRLPAPARARVLVRLGEAALAQNLPADAIAPLEEAAALEGAGLHGLQALGLLERAYAQVPDAQGQLETLVRLAKHRGMGDQAAEPSPLEQSLREARDAARRTLFSREDVPTDLKRAVFETLLEGADAPATLSLLPLLGTNPPDALVECVLARRPASSAEEKAGWALELCRLLPGKAPVLLREEAERLWDEGAHEPSRALMERRLELEETPTRRAECALEWGQTLLSKGASREEARGYVERAFREDARHTAAFQALLGLTSPDSEPERYAALLEEARRSGVDAEAAAHGPVLVELYERLGRLDDAYRVLLELPESEETLSRRLTLGEKLGRWGEVLPLRERRTQDAAELEALLRLALDLELAPQAAKLGRRLLEVGALTLESRRLLAEQLSRSVAVLGASAETEEEARLAASLWRDILQSLPNDADAWTSYARMLRAVGLEREAELCDGMGAALADEVAPAPIREASSVDTLAPLPDESESTDDLVARGLSAISHAVMPRLAHALFPVLSRLGVDEPRVFLDPNGGVEASFLDKRTLVLGAGALSAFGTAELGYLVVLSRVLGERGHLLGRPGVEVEGIERAALSALESYPSSLAACRVLAQLDPRVRGGNPGEVQVSRILPQSATFQRLVERLLG